MNAQIYVHGIIHSPAEPYATALVLDSGTITWLGADDTAQRIVEGGAQPVDLDGAVVTPLFVDPLERVADAATARTPGQALQRGIGATAQLWPTGHDAPAPDAAEADSPAPDTTAGVDLDAAQHISRYAPAASPEQLDRLLAAPAPTADHCGVWLKLSAWEPGALRTAVLAATQAGVQLYLVDPAGPQAEQGSGLDDVVAAVQAAREAGAPLLRARHRVQITGPVSDAQRAVLRDTACSATVLMDPHASAEDAPALGTLIADGVPVSLGGAPENPWAACQWALQHPRAQEQISARAAFAAMTRAPVRALPAAAAVPLAVSARIAVNEPAHLALWNADAVSVQSPDSRVSAWSTDARAGTPLLPDLSADTPLPRLRTSLIQGIEPHGTNQPA
ncbi:MAG: hypothetical protein Q4G34_06820 [Micrococcus sp.]|nr:hypothetical protein [Micrococcus sp.]